MNNMEMVPRSIKAMRNVERQFRGIIRSLEIVIPTLSFR